MANLAGPRGDGFAGSMNISYNVGPGPAVVNMGMRIRFCTGMHISLCLWIPFGMIL